MAVVKLLFFIMMVWLSGFTQTTDYKYFTAEGPSMAPSILANDRLTVDTGFYKKNSIERGDIVVFTASANGSSYIKRVVGLSGDKVNIADHKLYINDVIQEETYIQDEKINLDFPETIVDEHTVFVLGDNRTESIDSRIMGSIDVGTIIGKVIEVRHDEE